MSEWTAHERRLIRRAVFNFAAQARDAMTFYAQKGPHSSLEKMNAAAMDARSLESIYARMVEDENKLPKENS